jgi:peptide chain release factor subunit 1
MIDDLVLLRYLDGELDDQTAAAVAERLRHDPAQRQRLAELRAIEMAYGAGSETLPEARRNALLERLRREPPASPYDLVRRADLEALAGVRCATAPVFSLYLDLRPERRDLEPPLARCKSLLRQAEQRIDLEHRPSDYRARWAEEAGRLQEWLAGQQPLEGRGLALLSCQAIGLWRAYRLPVPVRDRLEAADRPYLRPLVTLLDEFERYLVVLIDAGGARLFEVALGAIEEVDALLGVVPPATGHFVEKTGHRHEAYLHRHARRVVEHVERFWAENRCDWLVIGGAAEALGELRPLLPKALRERLAGEVQLSPQAEPGQILDRVLAIERERERQIEAQRVDELIAAARGAGGGVLGLEATLLAIMEQRVRLLIVDEDYGQPGWECPGCGFLSAAPIDGCPVCGQQPESQPDIVEAALARTIEQKGEIEIVRGPAARQALVQHGRIGALLRYSYTAPAPDATAR